jgi:hypothetical protein
MMVNHLHFLPKGFLGKIKNYNFFIVKLPSALRTMVRSLITI